MADVTINYKGSSIATMDASGTKTLQTEGKYCEDDIEIVYVRPSGGSTPAISVVDTPDSAGGTVRTITALDISDTTAAAADVASGKYFYTAAGVKTAGTASSGGGGFSTVTISTAVDSNVSACCAAVTSAIEAIEGSGARFFAWVANASDISSSSLTALFKVSDANQSASWRGDSSYDYYRKLGGNGTTNMNIAAGTVYNYVLLNLPAST